MEDSRNTQTLMEKPITESINIDSSLSDSYTADSVLPAEVGEQSCPMCSSSKNSPSLQYIYALGRIEPHFSSLGLEKEFAQTASRKEMAGLSDQQVMHNIISEPQNRYLARKLCWLLSIQGLETYLLQPMNPADLDMLIQSLHPISRENDINVIIGILGPIAPPEYCNGLQIPVVLVDQVYSFDVNSLIRSIPKPDKVSDKVFTPIAEELFMRINQMTDNAGAIDDHRALNYLSVRYHAIYATAADCYSRNFSLTGVAVRTSALSGTRKIVDVVFTFTSRTTDVSEKYYCRVDVTEEFPFLVTKMQTYIDRNL